MGIGRGVAAARISTLVKDADLDLETYKLKTDHIAESTTSHGVVVDNTLAATITGVPKRLYTGNSGSDLFAEFHFPYSKAVVTGTTYTNSGISLVIPAGVFKAAIKFRFRMKCSGNYAGNLRVYKNGVYETGVYAFTEGTHTTIQWCNAYANISVSAGDVLTFYLSNNNASTATYLYTIQILGDVESAGTIGVEAFPAGWSG